jgi:hypothetical protein
MNEHENCDNCNYCGTKFVCPKCNCRAGILEGLRMALDAVMEEEATDDDPADYVQYCIKTTIQKLIKQYSGDE